MPEKANVTAPPQEAINVKRDRERSPSFPYIGLEKAVERTQKLYDNAKRFEARIQDAAKAWGLGEKSSATLQTVATLLAFGLIEGSGSGDTRKIKMSELGFKILTDQRPGVREKALAEAALKPKLIAEYADVWKDGRPSDNICLSELQVDRGFNQEAAERFLRVFDETISFAQIKKSDIENDKPSDNDDPKKEKSSEIKIGDLIQWESNGVLQLERPKVVRALQEHKGQEWVFVEGSETGIPMEQVSLIEKGTGTGTGTAHLLPPKLPLSSSPLEAGWQEERLLDDSGEEIFIRYKGDASLGRYEFIRDYLEFKINRLSPKKPKKAAATETGSED